VTDRFERAVAAIDAANADDPFTVLVDGVERPKELAHAALMVEWVRTLDPDADEAQFLAARAHHLRRWAYPRDAEPEGRAGYLRWRTESRRRHSALVGEILNEVGYDVDTVERVQALVSKRGLGKGDLPDVDGRPAPVQVHEDALCLVFLQTQFVALAEKLGERGRRAALGLEFDEPRRSLVEAALERLASGS
jgi:hypothetical protein